MSDDYGTEHHKWIVQEMNNTEHEAKITVAVIFGLVGLFVAAFWYVYLYPVY